MYIGWRNEITYIPDFSCDVVMTSFTPRGSVVVMCFQKSDVIRLVSFSSKNLLEVGIKTLVLIHLEHFLYRCLKYLLFECSLKKGNILNSPVPHMFEAIFFFSSPSNALYVTWRANEQIYQMAPPADQVFFQVKCIRCCFESIKTPSLL